LIAVPLLGLAATADYLSVARYFHGDEAVYFSMAQSLAHDRDIRYERKDLQRVFERFNQGPQGIVLKGVHAPDGEERVYFAKPFLYSALVAPLVGFAGPNGAFLVGVLLLLGSIALCADWLNRTGFRWPVLTASVLLGASVGVLYAFWIQPELLNFALVLLAYWLWRALGASTAALALLGAVTFSKIPTAVLALPVLGTLVLRRRYLALLCGGGAFVAAVAALFGLNLWATGEWNYQSGERSIFYFSRRFPYQQPGADPFFRPARPAAEESGADAPEPAPEAAPGSAAERRARGSGWSFRDAWQIYRIEPSMLWSNLGGFWVGRYSGHLLYWPLLCLLLVASVMVRPWRLEDALIWLCSAGAMLTFLVLAQDNYFGGSGTVGNRYFSMMLPPLIFTLRPPPLWWLRAALAASVLISSQLVLYPFMSLFNSGDHATREPFHSFPLELSLINSISIPNRNFLKLPFDEGRVLAYLPDSGTYGWEEAGYFWTRGDALADVVLRIPFRPLERVLLLLDSGAAEVRVDIDGAATASGLRLPEGGHLQVPLRLEHHYLHSSFYGGKSYIYPLRMRVRGGFVPAAAGVRDARFLGVRVRFTAEPVPLIRALLAQERWDEAAAAAASAEVSAETAELLSLAELARGQPRRALEWGEKALALGAAPGDLLPRQAVAALLSGRLLLAQGYARRLSELRPDWWWPRMIAARASLRAGSPGAAMAHALEAGRIAPEQIAPRLFTAQLSGDAVDLGALAGTPLPCAVDLDGVLRLEAVGLEWHGDSLHGRFLARVLRRPAERLRLFIHLLAGSQRKQGLFQALWSDLAAAIGSGRIAAHVPLETTSVSPDLWTENEPLVLSFELHPTRPVEPMPRVWLGVGLLSERDLERRPVSSPDHWVIRDRALMPLTAGLRATRAAAEETRIGWSEGSGEMR
jgi:hypothetical protein